MLIVLTLSEDEVRRRDDIAEDLISRIALGETSAMGELYELIGRDVFSYALAKTTDKENAEDVTHDTFVKVWKYAAQYTPAGKPLAWIFTIEINLIRRLYNKSKRFVPLEEAIEVEFDGDSFAEKIVNNEFLRQMLNSLNDEERTIVALHIVSGLKHREIARLLDKPLSTVLSKYNRSIKKLQTLVKEKEEH